MSDIDREYFMWEKITFGNGVIPEWKVCKQMYAEHLIKVKTKSQIWKMLCGPAKGPCLCKCPCAAGIAWSMLLEREQQEIVQNSVGTSD